ncbi:NAD(P)-dependent dehydrogenase (short-subunit alcohol dehydrogenase family) [Pseudorhizobium tarimense]|uniref:NAD(P)-dependent dehydrogenase (Short-subunit alcohol dehydrogenase family) n=1 Tax=Pseudorhizobium tarimense TaxID=1079109 RepID=A0ABV2H590_9HYPH|nr:SDR family NAD(P)-dependent oxidoreductase [Pseudorhizobium tarimense]MCJ8518652.1 SDR family oxidoreductase [Pseudorhizobium tarimense]
MQLQARVALVTGGGSGIGKATAITFAREGAKVAILGRTKSELDKTVAEIEAEGGSAVALEADVADEDAMRAAIAKLIETYGRLDVVVANAGVNGVWAPIDDLSPDEWDKTIRINLRGTYLTLHPTVPHMKEHGGGSIIIVSSINGNRTFTSPGATAYSATKAAQVAIVQQLAVELSRHKIRINAVCPGKIDTEIQDNTSLRDEDETAVPVDWPEGDIPLTEGAAGSSLDVADVILFLASHRARHVTGVPIFVDGAQSLLR